MIWRTLRLALSGVAFLTGFGACAAGLAHFFPLWKETDLMRAKLGRVAAQRAEYDTIFFGSSRVYRHIDPATFDAVTAAGGKPTHSFNCGMDGMFAPEDGFVAEQLFALHPQGLRHFFMELGTFLALAEAHAESTRSVAWHDLPRTWFIVRELFPEKEWERAQKRRKKKQGDERVAVLLTAWTRLQPHLECCLHHVTNLGHGHLLIAPRLLSESGSTNHGDEHILGPRGDGFAPMTIPPDPVQIDLFRQHLEERQKAPISDRTPDPLEEANFEAIVRLIRAAGAEPVVLIPPNPVPLRHLPPASLGILVLDFTDFRRWPELFQIEHRQDYGHLNQAGAEIYTRYLAEEWLKLQRPPAVATPH